MTTRWGLGPVFAFEWLTMSRRWQVYALRSLFVAALLFGMAVIWWNNVAYKVFTTIQMQSRAGEYYYETIATIQLALVLLAAPAATAGAVCLDKARGTLEHLLVTDLSDAEIILGKLGVRLVPVMGLVACALPVLAVGTLLGGIDPMALTGAFLVTLGVAVFSCALALTLSVWGRKTHEVLMGTYLVILLWLLAEPLIGFLLWNLGAAPATSELQWLRIWNPFFLVFAPYTDPGAVSPLTHAVFCVACLACAAGLSALAVVRVRAVTVRQAGRAAGGRALRLPSWVGWPSWWPRPSLDANPVLWREWQRNRPSRWRRWMWGFYALCAIACSAIAVVHFARQPAGRLGPGNDSAGIVNAFVVAIGLLLVSVSAASGLAEERVRGSLDVLLATPLSTRTILWGKWCGAFRAMPRLAALPTLVAAAIAFWTWRWGHVLLLLALVLSYGAVLASLGLALATWVSRLGRAVGLSVTAYVLSSIGWVILVVLISGRPENHTFGLVLGSPLYGALLTTFSVQSDQFMPRGFRDLLEVWCVTWIVLDAAVALALFETTVRTFEYCLGRMPETLSGFLTPPFPRPHSRTLPKPELRLE